MTEHEQTGPGDIAVVGMAGRFPKAANVDEFWQNLRRGEECISFFTDEELEASGVPPEVYNDPSYVKAWGWMDGVDMFDPGFFDVSPREAEITDPQIRILLETAWESLENAGCDPDRYPGRIGVFAGSSMMFYLWQNIAPTSIPPRCTRLGRPATAITRKRPREREPDFYLPDFYPIKENYPCLLIPSNWPTARYWSPAPPGRLPCRWWRSSQKLPTCTPWRGFARKRTVRGSRRWERRCWRRTSPTGRASRWFPRTWITY